MRKTLIVFTIFFSLLLSGCSLLEEVNQSLDYATEATEYINTWNDFGQEAPQLIQEAIGNPDVKAELEETLAVMLTEIEEFNQTEVPVIAEDIHQQVVDQSEQIKELIESNMTNGEVALEKLEESQLLQKINELTELMNLLEDLGV